MKNPFRPMGVTAGALALGLLATAGAAHAADAKDAPVVKPLMTQDLAGIAGKEGLMLTVEYPPGGASMPHRHDAEVFVYVLEGSLIMQVDGKPPVTLGPGQTFHEGPTDVHRQSANASKTAPAKFVVFMVKDKGKPTTLPAADKP
jgi:quercetin dioxygenase-like cupin family protein